MPALNEIEYSGLSSKLGEINQLSDQVSASLNGINDLIDQTVNSGAGIWDGESATQFKTGWVELADDFNTFITAFKKQAMNVSSLLSKTSAADESGNIEA